MFNLAGTSNALVPAAFVFHLLFRNPQPHDIVQQVLQIIIIDLILKAGYQELGFFSGFAAEAPYEILSAHI